VHGKTGTGSPGSAAFRVRGWSFIAAKTAFDDPIYTVPIDTLPAGESVVWASARATQIPGLRYPAEEPTSLRRGHGEGKSPGGSYPSSAILSLYRLRAPSIW
jgi:hypothetical protein